MLDHFCSEAVREREELRADLWAQAERAEHEADACRTKLARIRTGSDHYDGAASAPQTPDVKSGIAARRNWMATDADADDCACCWLACWASGPQGLAHTCGRMCPWIGMNGGARRCPTTRTTCVRLSSTAVWTSTRGVS